MNICSGYGDLVSNKLIPYTWMVLSDGTEQQPKIIWFRTEQMINVGAEISFLLIVIFCCYSRDLCRWKINSTIRENFGISNQWEKILENCDYLKGPPTSICNVMALMFVYPKEITVVEYHFLSEKFFSDSEQEAKVYKTNNLLWKKPPYPAFVSEPFSFYYRFKLTFPHHCCWIERSAFIVFAAWIQTSAFTLRLFTINRKEEEIVIRIHLSSKISLADDPPTYKCEYWSLVFFYLLWLNFDSGNL